jgi:hypothetical protein
MIEPKGKQYVHIDRKKNHVWVHFFQTTPLLLLIPLIKFNFNKNNKNIIPGY